MVEWKKLGEVCEVLRGKRLTKSQLNETDGYPVLHGGSTPMGYYTEFNRKANTTVVVNTGNAGSVFFYDKEFWSSDACFSLYPNKEIIDKYLYLYVYGCERILKGKIRAGAMPTIDANAVESLIIPIPSLQEQERIVGILDIFTASIDNLKAQIEQRRKQYEHYRDQLLDLEEKEGVEKKKLGEVCSVFDGTHQTPKYTESGVKFVSVENIGNIYASNKYISNEDFELKYKTKPQYNDVLMTRIGDVGTCAVVNKNEPIAFYVSLALLRPNNNIIYSKFVKYILESKKGKIELRKRTLLTAVPLKINLGDVGKVLIPLPSLQEQERIVGILDTFEASIKNLEAQLEQRQKQYEYYREKLLTFE